MKLIIDIPDEVYNFTTQRGHLPYGVNIAGSIIDGKVLPDDTSAVEGEIEVQYRNTLQKMLDSGILTYQHQINALEYAILLIQNEIDGEVE